jgi:MFS family permease
MWTNLGGAMANVVALTVFLLAALYMSDATFAAWGWRVPFLLSVVLVAIGLYVRLKIEETPAFEIEARRRRDGGGLPFKEAFTQGWKQILFGAGSLVMAFSLGYIGIAFLTNYGTATLHLTRPSVLLAGIVGNLVNALFCGLGGVLSDRFGRRRVLLAANTIGIPWALLLFPVLDAGTIGAFYLGLIVTFMIAGVGFGVAGSFLSELFPTRYRYTAAGLSYSLGGVLGGAIPPLVAASIIGSYGSFTFGVLLAAYCLVGLLCTLALRETQGSELIDPAPAFTGEAT